MSDRPTAVELLENPHALLTRTRLRELGLERGAIDSIFRKLPTVHLPGYSRPMIRVSDYLKFVEDSSYDGRTRSLS
jgi:hypothetical protein